MVSTIGFVVLIFAVWVIIRDEIKQRRVKIDRRRRKYQKALRRMAERRYRRSAIRRQQVRVLEHTAWQMRRDGSPPPQQPHVMLSVDLLPWLTLRPIEPLPPPVGRPGLAGLIGRAYN